MARTIREPSLVTKEDWTDYDWRKYYAARRIWVKRHRQTTSGQCPRPKRSVDSLTPVCCQKYTWACWFERMFDERLENYAIRMKEDGRG